MPIFANTSSPEELANLQHKNQVSMRGMLKMKSPGTQLLLVISIALVGFFIIGLAGTMILSAVSGMNMLEMSDVSKWDFSNPATINVVRGMQVIQFISLFLIPTVICSRLFSTNSKEYLGLKPPYNGMYIIAGILAMALAIPLVNWVGEINRQVHFPAGIASWMKAKEDEAAQTIKGLLQQHTVKDLVINIICIAGLAAVGEELLFRGLLQRIFIKMFKSPWIGIAMAAFLFSAMHLQFYGFLPRFVLGLVLGAIFWYSGSLWVSMIAHFVYDAVLIILAWYRPDMLNNEDSVKINSLVASGIISLALLIGIIIWMKRMSKTTYSSVYADDAIPYKDDPF